VLTISRMMVKSIFTQEAVQTPKPNPMLSTTASNAFLDILYHSGIDFNRTRVLVVDISKYPTFDVQRVVQSAAYSDVFKKSLRFINVAPLDEPSLFYPLDNHLNAEGHAVLADVIQQEILRDSNTVR